MSFGMNKPYLFQTSAEKQKWSNLEFVKENSHRMQWKKNGDTAIDVGCADGSVSILVKNYKPFENHYYKNFLASDINENMVKYAQEHYGSDNMSFRALNIEEDLPEELKGGFNHVFSFKTLQLVQNQKKAFKNIYDLLTDDGDIMMTVMGFNDIYSVYNILSRQPKWKTLLKNVNSFVSPYHQWKYPEKEITRILKKCGFKDIDVQCRSLSYSYNYQFMKDFIQAVEPFNMPQEVFDELMIDYFTIGKEQGLITVETNNGTDAYIHNYTVIVIYAKK